MLLEIGHVCEGADFHWKTINITTTIYDILNELILLLEGKYRLHMLKKGKLTTSLFCTPLRKLNIGYSMEEVSFGSHKIARLVGNCCFTLVLFFFLPMFLIPFWPFFSWKFSL